jgi:hypothetical protein
MTDAWHFPRTELAENYLRFFDTGVAPALVLFAPRRRGKTEFLLHDLGPSAEASGYRVVYASFWQSPLAPAAALLYALEDGWSKRSFAERAGALLTRPVEHVTLSGTLGPLKGEAIVDVSDVPKRAPADLLLYLDDLIGRLSKRKRLLLLLDEVQQLRMSRENGPLVAGLRTSLDKLGRRVSTVFTGSSRTGLMQVFSDKEAPFFHFASQIDLPRLDDGFVQHQIGVFKQITRRTLLLREALDLFVSLDRSPFFFRKLIETLVLNPDDDLASGMARMRTQLAAELGYPQLWTGLKPMERAVVRWLATTESRAAFTEEARKAAGAATGAGIATISAVQTAIRRLVSEGVLVQSEPRRYDFEDAEFEGWVRRLVEEDPARAGRGREGGRR